MASGYVEFEDSKLIKQTEKAGLFEIDDQGQFWIPWSQTSLKITGLPPVTWISVSGRTATPVHFAC